MVLAAVQGELHEGGTSIALMNHNREVLLCLRDDKPDIPYPGCWDLLGGHCEPDETPSECIIREIREEIGYDLKGPVLFATFNLDDRVEWMFWELAEIDIEAINLTEGERLEWFSGARIEQMPDAAFAFNFRALLLGFVKNMPFLGCR